MAAIVRVHRAAMVVTVHAHLVVIVRARPAAMAEIIHVRPQAVDLGLLTRR